jgi:phosphatidylinositol alpha-mannosyltransferase
MKKKGFDVKIIYPKFDKEGIGVPDGVEKGDTIKVGLPIPIILNSSLSYIGVGMPKTAKKILREHNFDIIHFHEPTAHPFMWSFLYHSDSINIATFHTYKGSMSSSLVKVLKFLGRPIVEILNSKIHGRIAVSEAAKKLASKFVEGEYKIVPNGVDVARFKDAEPFAEFSDTFNILFVGRLEPRKGIRHLIKAYKTFRKIAPKSKLIIAGSGLSSYYKAFVPSKIEDNVFFVGPVPFDMIPRFYASADICVFPSTKSESFGIVLIEAMAAGKPVIASRIDGYCAVVEDGKNGILVEPEDDDELARAMVELYFKNDVRRKLEEGGREKAREFDWTKIVDRITEFYAKVTSGHA